VFNKVSFDIFFGFGDACVVRSSNENERIFSPWKQRVLVLSLSGRGLFGSNNANLIIPSTQVARRIGMIDVASSSSPGHGSFGVDGR
jgi:hypothetical protein